MLQPILDARYRQALCPYLAVGNGRLLVHLDVYGVPHSLHWPAPGAPDRLGWRDPLDEWPYWEEMPDEAVRARVPYVDYPDGARDYLHEAVTVESGYVEDTNILLGRYTLRHGAVVSLETLVPPGRDVWVRRYILEGGGTLALPGGFFEKAVRGHAATHLGDIPFRGGCTASPRGAYVFLSDPAITLPSGRAALNASAGGGAWTLCLSFGKDIAQAAEAGRTALSAGVDTLRRETADADRAWIAQVRPPVEGHPFVRRHYRRWLLGNRLVTGKNGAMVCGPRPFWSFAWPRDCSLQIAGYALAGCTREARAVTEWLLERAPESGVYDARYFWDGTPMRLDQRPRQMDGPGFVAWAAGMVCRTDWDRAWAEAIAPRVYALADTLIRERDPETRLPTAGGDHRETEVAQSIGIAVTAFGGLEGAAYIAANLGDDSRAGRYQVRAHEIRAAAESHLMHSDGYFMTSVKPRREQADIGACWGAWPMRMWPAGHPALRATVRRLFEDRWEDEAGGFLMCRDTPYESIWMYHGATLLLGVAGIGDRAAASRILDGLEHAAPPHGLMPEQIGRATGALWGCAPLPVTHAALLIHAYAK